jgi:hypothetical protein
MLLKSDWIGGGGRNDDDSGAAAAAVVALGETEVDSDDPDAIVLHVGVTLTPLFCNC